MISSVLHKWRKDPKRAGKCNFSLSNLQENKTYGDQEQIYIYIPKANFLAGRIERPGPAHGSPKGVSGLRQCQNEPNSAIWARIQLPKYCELSEAIQHESRLFDVLGDGKSRIVIIQLDFVKSSIFDEFWRF